jgi:hypothetical protein
MLKAVKTFNAAALNARSPKWQGIVRSCYDATEYFTLGVQAKGKIKAIQSDLCEREQKAEYPCVCSWCVTRKLTKSCSQACEQDLLFVGVIYDLLVISSRCRKKKPLAFSAEG